MANGANDDVLSDNHVRQLVILLARYDELSGLMGISPEDVHGMTVAELLDDLVGPMSTEEQRGLMRDAERNGLNPEHNPFFRNLPLTI